MRKIFRITVLLGILFFLPSLAHAVEAPKKWINYDTDKIIASDPSKITETQFYNYKQAIIGAFSGSGGFFLGKPEIEWLQKAVAALESRGIKLKEQYTGETNLGYVYADSYFHLNEYKKAIEEYQKIGYSGGAEEIEWYLNNEGINNGVVKVVEYPGKIQYGSEGDQKAEDSEYLFESYFRGPIYRYDKANNKHAVIYAPPTEYDWCVSLKWDGKRLLIKLRDDAGQFEFDNGSNSLRKITK